VLKEASTNVLAEISRLDIATEAIAEQVKEGNFYAIDRWLKISERRSKLLGLEDKLKLAVEITGNNGDAVNIRVQQELNLVMEVLEKKMSKSAYHEFVNALAEL
jgi:basic membrane lipoprotein Med (substrate-binding protein (PBP1-ABC) superfamily)